MMTIKKFTNEEIKKIIEKVKELGDAPMKPGSQGFDKFGRIKIIEAAEKQTEDFKNQEKNAAIAVMGVVLGANRNWEKQVRIHVDKLKTDRKDLTFKQIQGLLRDKNYQEFKDVWGHKDEKKYNTLTALVAKILEFSEANPTLNDLDLMREWVGALTLKNRKDQSSPGSIPNVGIATYQHLRIVFGIDTVKPDQRVKEVLFEEFGKNFRTDGGKKLSDEKTILAIQDIAEITGHQVIMIDQIFVKYGSGYYISRESSSRSKTPLTRASCI